MSVEIPVRRGGEVVAWATVDDALAPMLGLWKWSLNGSGYAFGSPGFMHRVILGLGKKDPGEIDHANRDRLDNRLENLRFATRGENCRNSARAESASEARARVKELWASGHTRPEIAAQIGRPYAFVAITLRGVASNGRSHPNVVWTQDAIADFIRAFHAQHGRLPSGHDMNGKDGRPWFTAVYRRFGSMADARTYAGFTTVDLRRAA